MHRTQPGPATRPRLAVLGINARELAAAPSARAVDPVRRLEARGLVVRVDPLSSTAAATASGTSPPRRKGPRPTLPPASASKPTLSASQSLPALPAAPEARSRPMVVSAVLSGVAAASPPPSTAPAETVRSVPDLGTDASELSALPLDPLLTKPLTRVQRELQELSAKYVSRSATTRPATLPPAPAPLTHTPPRTVYSKHWDPPTTNEELVRALPRPEPLAPTDDDEEVNPTLFPASHIGEVESKVFETTLAPPSELHLPIVHAYNAADLGPPPTIGTSARTATLSARTSSSTRPSSAPLHSHRDSLTRARASSTSGQLRSPSPPPVLSFRPGRRGEEDRGDEDDSDEDGGGEEEDDNEDNEDNEVEPNGATRSSNGGRGGRREGGATLDVGAECAGRSGGNPGAHTSFSLDAPGVQGSTRGPLHSGGGAGASHGAGVTDEDETAWMLAMVLAAPSPRLERGEVLTRKVHRLSRKQRASRLDEQIDSFVARLAQAHGEEAAPRFSREERRQLRELFDFLDTDGSGCVDYEELEDPMLSTGIVRDHRELDQLLERVDENGDGEVSFAEFIQAFLPSRRTMRARRHAADPHAQGGKRAALATLKPATKESTHFSDSIRQRVATQHRPPLHLPRRRTAAPSGSATMTTAAMAATTAGGQAERRSAAGNDAGEEEEDDDEEEEGVEGAEGDEDEGYDEDGMARGGGESDDDGRRAASDGEQPRRGRRERGAVSRPKHGRQGRGGRLHRTHTTGAFRSASGLTEGSIHSFSGLSLGSGMSVGSGGRRGVKENGGVGGTSSGFLDPTDPGWSESLPALRALAHKRADLVERLLDRVDRAAGFMLGETNEMPDLQHEAGLPPPGAAKSASSQRRRNSHSSILSAARSLEASSGKAGPGASRSRGRSTHEPSERKRPGLTGASRSGGAADQEQGGNEDGKEGGGGGGGGEAGELDGVHDGFYILQKLLRGHTKGDAMLPLPLRLAQQRRRFLLTTFMHSRQLDRVVHDQIHRGLEEAIRAVDHTTAARLRIAQQRQDLLTLAREERIRAVQLILRRNWDRHAFLERVKSASRHHVSDRRRASLRMAGVQLDAGKGSGPADFLAALSPTSASSPSKSPARSRSLSPTNRDPRYAMSGSPTRSAAFPGASSPLPMPPLSPVARSALFSSLGLVDSESGPGSTSSPTHPRVAAGSAVALAASATSSRERALSSSSLSSSASASSPRFAGVAATPGSPGLSALGGSTGAENDPVLAEQRRAAALAASAAALEHRKQMRTKFRAAVEAVKITLRAARGFTLSVRERRRMHRIHTNASLDSAAEANEGGGSGGGGDGGTAQPASGRERGRAAHPSPSSAEESESRSTPPTRTRSKRVLGAASASAASLAPEASATGAGDAQSESVVVVVVDGDGAGDRTERPEDRGARHRLDHVGESVEEVGEDEDEEQGRPSDGRMGDGGTEGSGLEDDEEDEDDEAEEDQKPARRLRSEAKIVKKDDTDDEAPPTPLTEGDLKDYLPVLPTSKSAGAKLERGDGGGVPGYERRRRIAPGAAEHAYQVARLNERRINPVYQRIATQLAAEILEARWTPTSAATDSKPAAGETRAAEHPEFAEGEPLVAGPVGAKKSDTGLRTAESATMRTPAAPLRPPLGMTAPVPSRTLESTPTVPILAPAPPPRARSNPRASSTVGGGSSVPGALLPSGVPAPTKATERPRSPPPPPPRPRSPSPPPPRKVAPAAGDGGVVVLGHHERTELRVLNEAGGSRGGMQFVPLSTEMQRRLHEAVKMEARLTHGEDAMKG